MDGELARVAAGVGAELALVGPLVRVDPQVLLEAAAVYGGVVTQVTLVGLHAGVATHVHGQVVFPAEALVTELTLVGFVSFKHIRKIQGFKGFSVQVTAQRSDQEGSRGRGVCLFLLSQCPDRKILEYKVQRVGKREGVLVTDGSQIIKNRKEQVRSG